MMLIVNSQATGNVIAIISAPVQVHDEQDLELAEMLRINREIRKEQDAEFAESLRVDREKDEVKKKMKSRREVQWTFINMKTQTSQAQMFGGYGKRCVQFHEISHVIYFN